MTSTLCQSAALERIIAPCTAMIAEFLHTIVKTILTIAEIVRTTLDEAMGRHARLLRQRTGLPAAFGGAGEDHRQLQGRSRRLLVRADTRSLASLVAELLLGWSREEQPAEANGDDGEGKLMDLEEPEGHNTGSERQTCPHVKCLRGFVDPLSATEH